MELNPQNWTYNEFLAFVMVYGAEMNYNLSPEELEFIKQKTEISDINKVKAKVDSINDAEALDLIDEYRKHHLNDADKVTKVRRDLEALLHSGGTHSQLEGVAIHILERLLKS